MTNIRQKITFQNFFKNTRASFTDCEIPDRAPDYESDSGSKYWYGNDECGDYVIRDSTHWSHFEIDHYNPDLFIFYMRDNHPYRHVGFNGCAYYFSFKMIEEMWGVRGPGTMDFKILRKGWAESVGSIGSCRWTLNIKSEQLTCTGKAYLHNFTTMESQILKTD